MKVPIIVFKTVNGFSASIVGLKYLYLCHETYEELKEVGEPIPTAENPLFLAKDVAELIDYSKTSQGYYNTSKMLMSIDGEEKITITNCNSGGSKVFLTEDGLYEVLI